MRALVVAAARSEVRHLPPEVDVVLCGIGKTEAAIATTRALAELSPDERAQTVVVNIGSCGALRARMRGVFEPGVVLNHDFSADAVRALGHEPHERIEIPTGDPALVLATGDLFVADSAVRDDLARRAHLVDMEGYAVARAAQTFGVPIRLVKHVSDEADEGAVAWADLVERSAQDLGRWWSRTMGRARR